MYASPPPCYPGAQRDSSSRCTLQREPVISFVDQHKILKSNNVEHTTGPFGMVDPWRRYTSRSNIDSCGFECLCTHIFSFRHCFVCSFYHTRPPFGILQVCELLGLCLLGVAQGEGFGHDRKGLREAYGEDSDGYVECCVQVRYG